jgi:hypothetical protein
MRDRKMGREAEADEEEEKDYPPSSKALRRASEDDEQPRRIDFINGQPL